MMNAANGSDEGRLQLDELRADFLEVQGDLEGARTIAATMHPLASAMGFEPIARRAKELLDSDTLLTRFERDVRESETADEDVGRAAESDERLARLAGHFFETLETPSARYDVVLQHVRVIRRMAQERVNWCRHLVMLEDLSKSIIQETAFSELPSRICQCGKFGYTSEHGALDATIVIAGFKHAYCRKCQARDPKQTQSPTDRSDKAC